MFCLGIHRPHLHADLRSFSCAARARGLRGRHAWHRAITGFRQGAHLSCFEIRACRHAGAGISERPAAFSPFVSAFTLDGSVTSAPGKSLLAPPYAGWPDLACHAAAAELDPQTNCRRRRSARRGLRLGAPSGSDRHGPLQCARRENGRATARRTRRAPPRSISNHLHGKRSRTEDEGPAFHQCAPRRREREAARVSASGSSVPAPEHHPRRGQHLGMLRHVRAAPVWQARTRGERVLHQTVVGSRIRLGLFRRPHFRLSSCRRRTSQTPVSGISRSTSIGLSACTRRGGEYHCSKFRFLGVRCNTGAVEVVGTASPTFLSRKSAAQTFPGPPRRNPKAMATLFFGTLSTMS